MKLRIPLLMALAGALSVGAGGCRNPVEPPPAQKPGDKPPAPAPKAAGEEAYTIRLPSDRGLIADSDFVDGLVATLRFRKADGNPTVRLRVRSSRIHVSTEKGIRSAVERGGFTKIEEVIAEGEPGRPEKKEDPPLVDAATGQGTAGLREALARLAKEIRAQGREALLEIDASLDAPAGLVLEGFRRGGGEPGIVSAAFTGSANPLEAGSSPLSTIWTEDAELAIRVDESLLRDPSDGFPAMLVSEASGKPQVELPFALEPAKADPGEEEGGGRSALARLGAVMKAFADRERDPEDPRRSNGWLVIRMPAEAPYGVLQAMMMVACRAGIGLYKIRVLLPAGHAFM